MKQIFPPHLFVALAFVTSFAITSATHSQVNGSEVSNSLPFDTVINIPSDPDIVDGETIGGVIDQTTQLNLFDGGTIGSFVRAEAGSEVNILGGSVGPNFTVANSELNISDGFLLNLSALDSTVDMTGGFIGSNFRVIQSEVSISDGSIEGPLNVLGSTVSISGGDFSFFFARFGSEINITGGNFGFNLLNPVDAPAEFRASNGGTVNISGGMFDGSLRAVNGSTVNLRGTDFFVDGVRVDALTPNTPLTIDDRDVTLTGTLLDGSGFSFYLSSQDDPDLFSADSTLTVTVPEPTGFVLLLAAGTASLLVRRRV